MRYDFRKVQEAMDLSGKTLRELGELIGVDYTTISKAVKTGRAHQKTAVKLVTYFGIPMKEIVKARKRVRTAA